MLGKHMSEQAKLAIGRANKGRVTWNKGGKNTWAKRAAKTRVSRYDFVILAEHKDGRKLTFSHVEDAARGVGVRRESVKNILRGEAHRTRNGWAFSKCPKGQ